MTLIHMMERSLFWRKRIGHWQWLTSNVNIIRFCHIPIDIGRWKGFHICKCDYKLIELQPINKLKVTVRQCLYKTIQSLHSARIIRFTHKAHINTNNVLTNITNSHISRGMINHYKVMKIREHNKKWKQKTWNVKAKIDIFYYNDIISKKHHSNHSNHSQV